MAFQMAQTMQTRSGLQFPGDAQAGRCKQNQRIHNPLWDVWRQQHIVGHIPKSVSACVILCYLLTLVPLTSYYYCPDLSSIFTKFMQSDMTSAHLMSDAWAGRVAGCIRCSTEETRCRGAWYSQLPQLQQENPMEGLQSC